MSEQKSTELTIAVMQANPHLGNVKANFESLCQKRKRAADMGADCLLTPETVSYTHLRAHETS